MSVVAYNVQNKVEPYLTSGLVVPLRFKEVKSGRGPILHGEVLADPKGGGGADTPHLSIQGGLEVPTLPPQQRWNVSVKKTQHKP